MPADPDLLAKIREHPGLFLGESTLSALYHTINGYALALGSHGIKDDFSLRLPADFNDWVAYRLHYKESTSGWKNMILSVCKDDVEAFKRFFELLDQYASRKSRVVAKIIGFEKTFAIGVEGQQRLERYPDCISLIVYTDDPGFFAVSDEPGRALPMAGFFPSLDWFESFILADRSRLTVLDTDTFERWCKYTDVNDSPDRATRGA